MDKSIEDILYSILARKFNLAKSEAMLRNVSTYVGTCKCTMNSGLEVTVYIYGYLLIQHLEFRKTWNADTIVEDYKPPEVRCTGSIYTLSTISNINTADNYNSK